MFKVKFNQFLVYLKAIFALARKKAMSQIANTPDASVAPAVAAQEQVSALPNTAESLQQDINQLSKQLDFYFSAHVS